MADEYRELLYGDMEGALDVCRRHLEANGRLPPDLLRTLFRLQRESFAFLERFKAMQAEYAARAKS